MKLFLSTFAYLVMGGFLVAGIIHLMKGSPWLLIISGVAYLLLFARLGCLPKSSSSESHAGH